MKKQSLDLFIEKRNSNAFYSNLQFSVDAVNYGIEHAELGESIPIPGGYSWETPYGRLEEVGGVLTLIESNQSVNNYNRIEVLDE
ncbi:MAG: hypothetical protein ACC653_11110 [Gammaproteobacteria bacterium]